jgi:hypothetical protein
MTSRLQKWNELGSKVQDVFIQTIAFTLKRVLQTSVDIQALQA